MNLFTVSGLHPPMPAVGAHRDEYTLAALLANLHA